MDACEFGCRFFFGERRSTYGVISRITLQKSIRDVRPSIHPGLLGHLCTVDLRSLNNKILQIKVFGLLLGRVLQIKVFDKVAIPSHTVVEEGIPYMYTVRSYM